MYFSLKMNLDSFVSIINCLNGSTYLTNLLLFILIVNLIEIFINLKFLISVVFHFGNCFLRIRNITLFPISLSILQQLLYLDINRKQLILNFPRLLTLIFHVNHVLFFLYSFVNLNEFILDFGDAVLNVFFFEFDPCFVWVELAFVEGVMSFVACTFVKGSIGKELMKAETYKKRLTNILIRIMLTLHLILNLIPMWSHKII